jgi:hypothetical protein
MFGGGRVLTILGIFVIVGGLLGSGLGTPAVARFSGATANTASYTNAAGCSRLVTHTTTWSNQTGNGSLRGATYARSCPASRGGANNSSIAYQELQISAGIPLRLPSGKGGVNLTLDLRAFGNQGANVSAPKCPGIYDAYYHAFSYDCIAQASIGMEAWDYLVDLKNFSTTFASNEWPGVSNNTTNENVTSLVNTSTSSNLSTTNATLGGPGTIRGHYVLQFFINGTFVATHKYELVVIFYVFEQSAIIGYPRLATAHTSVDLGGPAGHLDILPLSIW